MRVQDEAWFVAVAKKKTARGVLFFYPQTDELEFISKQKLQDYTKREVRTFWLFCTFRHIISAEPRANLDSTCASSRAT